jgi:transcriptional regulator with XRE-family HTH domain
MNTQTVSTVGNFSICGQRLKHFRSLQGWTQEELAHRAGYTDRLIRKAESGRSVSLETIRNLACCLSCNGISVHLDDLMESSRATVNNLIVQLKQRSSESLDQIFAANAVLDCKGCERIPFVGSWNGFHELQNWFGIFYDSLESNMLIEQILAAINDEIAFVRLLLVFRCNGRRSQPLEIILRMAMEKNRIQYLCVNADSKDIDEFFSETRLS